MRDNSPAYKKWRAAVLKRDRYTCQMPGCRYKVRRFLQAHHIRRYVDAPLLRYNTANGITLCYRCHKRIWNKEDIYAKIFNRIVNQS